MVKHQIVMGICCSLALVIGGCSRQQSDWQKTRESNTADAYEQFLKKYPSGEFTPQAQARVKELYEEHDWQKARDADTAEAYQAFLKEYPDGKWTEEARIRVENFTLAQTPSGSGAASPSAAEPASSASSSAAGMVAAESSALGTPPVKVAKPQLPSVAAPVAPPVSRDVASVHSSAPTALDKATSGRYAVQLGAFKSGAAAAKDRWMHLQHSYPAVFAGLSSKVVPKQISGGSLYRLQTAGLSEKHAKDICVALKAKAQPCMVIPPA